MSESEKYTACCHDCGRKYGDEFGFPDLVISNDAWRRISPTGDDGGMLCPSCICQRLWIQGLTGVDGAFMSGPVRSVDRSLMSALRWTENIHDVLRARGLIP